MRSQEKAVLWMLTSAVVVWLGLILAAPVARQAESNVAPFLYAGFHTICHQLPQRSFHLAGHPLAVCHRCSGIYVGFLAGLLLFPRLPRPSRWLSVDSRRVLPFFVPMVVDVLLPNATWSRTLTGAAAGFPVALLVWTALVELWTRGEEARERG